MVNRIVGQVTLAFVGLVLGGCGTFVHTMTGGESVYGGVQAGWKEVQNADDACFLCTDAEVVRRCRQTTKTVFLLDLPFSFIADTLILPYSLPCTIWRLCHDAPAPPEQPSEKVPEFVDGCPR